MKDSNSGNISEDFIIAQYNQIWASMRMHLRLSWQIPTFVMVAMAALITTAPKNLTTWEKEPVITGLAFFLLSFSASVLFIHHRRNNIFVKKYGVILRNIENKYGIITKSHHSDLSEQLTGFDKISSTSMLIYFLGLISIGTFIISIIFFITALN